MGGRMTPALDELKEWLEGWNTLDKMPEAQFRRTVAEAVLDIAAMLKAQQEANKEAAA
jgi:hypothetical protein